MDELVFRVRHLLALVACCKIFLKFQFVQHQHQRAFPPAFKLQFPVMSNQPAHLLSACLACAVVGTNVDDKISVRLNLC